MLNVNEPSDQCLVAELPYWIRLLAGAINSLGSNPYTDFNVTDLAIAAGSTTIDIGIDLSKTPIEVILTHGIGGASAIQHIRNGTNGQIKLFVFLDSDISFVDGTKDSGKIYLNQLPALSVCAFEPGDAIALVNIGGDGSTEYGYWKEIWRQVSVK
jgi:hypothetical protein